MGFHKPALFFYSLSSGLLVCGADALVWQWRNPLPHGNDIHAVAAGNGRIVAVGDCRSIVMSTNLSDWTRARPFEQATELRSAAYGNGKFVAVGYGPTQNTILHSADGLNWAVASLPESGFRFGLGFNSVVFANGEFLAPIATYPGNFGAILTSRDGAIWTEVGIMTTSGRKLRFLNGKYVLFGGDTLQYSNDGRNWSFPPNDPPEGLRDIAYGNGIYVAVDVNHYNFQNGYRIFSSFDLSAWWTRVSHYVSNAVSMAGVAYGNGRFVALGSVHDSKTDIYTNLYFTSINGTAWTQHAPLPSLARPREIVFTGQEFVAVGEYGNISTSVDGLTWTHPSRGTQNNFRGVACGQGRFVAVGNDGTNVTSVNGITWTPAATGTEKNLREVTFADGKFMAVGSDGTILSSLNGLNWTAEISGTGENLFDVAYGNGVWVAVGGDQRNNEWRAALLTSNNGIDWVTRISEGWSTDGTQLHGVTYANGRFVVVGDRGVVLASADGVTWTTNRAIGSSRHYYKSVAYGNGRFVAVGEGDDSILVSTDGVIWQPYAAPDVALDQVEFAEGRFMAVGEDGLIMSSTNGVDWVFEPSPTVTRLRDIVHGAGSWVAVGNNDTILQSPADEHRIISFWVQPASVTLAWQSQPGRTYYIDYKPTLTTADWIPVSGGIVAQGTQASWTGARPSGSSAFYRVVMIGN